MHDRLQSHLATDSETHVRSTVDPTGSAEEPQGKKVTKPQNPPGRKPSVTPFYHLQILPYLETIKIYYFNI